MTQVVQLVTEAREAGVHILFFPLHVTSTLHPLNVFFVKDLHDKIQDCVVSLVNAGAKKIQREDIPRITLQVRKK